MASCLQYVIKIMYSNNLSFPALTPPLPLACDACYCMWWWLLWCCFAWMLSHVLQSASAGTAGYYDMTATLQPAAAAAAAAATAAAQAAGMTPTASLPDQKLSAATAGYLGMCSKRFGWQVRVLIHTMPAQTLSEKR